MAKRDVLDKKMAQKFAWGVAKPADLLETADKRSASLDAALVPGTPEQKAYTKEAGRQRDELVTHTARVWQITSPSLQAKETAKLLRRVHSLSLFVAAMRGYPRESLCLWRLVVRHYETLSAPGSNEAMYWLTFMPIDTSLREAAELLIEVAEKGDSQLAFLMDVGEVATEAAARKHPELGRGLARILDDEGKPWSSRLIAARWLSLTEPRVAAPPLRRALFLPHAGIRTAALEVLTAIEPPAVTEADVLWLLEDAVKHPLPVGPRARSFEMADSYGNALIAAVAKRPPPEGFLPLETILNGDAEQPIKKEPGLDDAWALRALAAGYPERAIAHIDPKLYGNKGWHRSEAIDAVELLPDELARPRLLEAASRPGHTASERAKALWFKRFGEACPVSDLTGVDVEILAAPPSERFLSRLSVLRGSSDEAKAGMIKVLLAEENVGEPGPRGAPPGDLSASERETLALLLFSQSDYVPGRPDLPSSEQDWAELLFRRFGEPAFAGMLKVAAHSTRAGADHEWLAAFGRLAQEGALSEAQRARLRDVAGEALRSPAWSGAISPLLALNHVGAPIELVDRLWAIVMAELPEGVTQHSLFRFATHWASEALTKMTDAPGLDARLAEEAEKALRSRDYDRLEHVVPLGCRRRVPRVIEIALRCIDVLDEDPAARDAAHACGYALEEAKRIEEAWLVGLLRKPESLRFPLATLLVRRQTSPATLAALETALESPARDGAAAAEAAEALVAIKAMDPGDGRLDGILDRAPPPERASLVGLLLRSEAPLSRFARYIPDLLVHGDEKAAGFLLDDLDTESEDARRLLESVLPLSPPASVRSGIEYLLQKPGEADLYFQDEGEEDAEGDGEDDGGDDGDDGDGDGDGDGDDDDDDGDGDDYLD